MVLPGILVIFSVVVFPAWVVILYGADPVVGIIHYRAENLKVETTSFIY